ERERAIGAVQFAFEFQRPAIVSFCRCDVANRLIEQTAVVQKSRVNRMLIAELRFDEATALVVQTFGINVSPQIDFERGICQLAGRVRWMCDAGLDAKGIEPFLECRFGGVVFSEALISARQIDAERAVFLSFSFWRRTFLMNRDGTLK